ncbi:hypothetical protein M3J09_004838 [Ascochyta lentis]
MADGPSTLPAESANSPQHHILLSIPRTASNLLTHLLALHSQPSIAPHPRDGYFFLPALSFRFTHDTLMQPYETRNDLEKKNMQSSIDNGIKGWKSRINETEEKRKGTYIKEHVTRPIRPSPERAFLHDEKSDSNSSGTANETAQRYTNPQSSLTRSGLASEPLSSPRPSALVPECAAPASITRGSTPGAARARRCRGGSVRIVGTYFSISSSSRSRGRGSRRKVRYWLATTWVLLMLLPSSPPRSCSTMRGLWVWIPRG